MITVQERANRNRQLALDAGLVTLGDTDEPKTNFVREMEAAGLLQRREWTDWEYVGEGFIEVDIDEYWAPRWATLYQQMLRRDGEDSDARKSALIRCRDPAERERVRAYVCLRTGEARI